MAMKRLSTLFNIGSNKPKQTSFSVKRLKEIINGLDEKRLKIAGNKKLMVVSLKELSEIMVWGDENNHQEYWNTFLEGNTLIRMFNILKSPDSNASIHKQLIQSLTIMITGFSTKNNVYYMLSNRRINEIICHPFRFDQDDLLLQSYISFLRGVVIRFNKNLIQFFIDNDANSFHIFSESIKYHDHSEHMVRIAIRTITLKIFSINDPTVMKIILETAPANTYFTKVCKLLKQEILKLNKLLYQRRVEKTAYFKIKTLSIDIQDQILYLNEIFHLKNDKISEYLLKVMEKELIDDFLIPSIKSENDFFKVTNFLIEEKKQENITLFDLSREGRARFTKLSIKTKYPEKQHVLPSLALFYLSYFFQEMSYDEYRKMVITKLFQQIEPTPNNNNVEQQHNSMKDVVISKLLSKDVTTISSAILLFFIIYRLNHENNSQLFTKFSFNESFKKIWNLYKHEKKSEKNKQQPQQQVLLPLLMETNDDNDKNEVEDEYVYPKDIVELFLHVLNSLCPQRIIIIHLIYRMLMLLVYEEEKKNASPNITTTKESNVGGVENVKNPPISSSPVKNVKSGGMTNKSRTLLNKPQLDKLRKILNKAVDLVSNALLEEDELEILDVFEEEYFQFASLAKAKDEMMFFDISVLVADNWDDREYHLREPNDEELRKFCVQHFFTLKSLYHKMVGVKSHEISDILDIRAKYNLNKEIRVGLKEMIKCYIWVYRVEKDGKRQRFQEGRYMFFEGHFMYFVTSHKEKMGVAILKSFVPIFRLKTAFIEDNKYSLRIVGVRKQKQKFSKTILFDNHLSCKEIKKLIQQNVIRVYKEKKQLLKKILTPIM